MSEEIRIIGASLERAEISLPAFGSTPPLVLDVSLTKAAEARLYEVQVVNPSTYSNLEFVIGVGYRECKRHISVIGYQITLAEKALRTAKSIALLDEYPVFLKTKNIKDSAQIRDAYLETCDDYKSAQDRIDMLKALDSLIDGKIKVFENTSRCMKKQMDIILRSGIDSNKYVR